MPPLKLTVDEARNLGLPLPAKAQNHFVDDPDRPKKPSRIAGTMNKIEAAMSLELDGMLRNGIVKRWRFEAVKLRLAKATWFTCDFQVWLADGRIVMLETKGFLHDDAGVKFKVAREMYPEYLWMMVERKHGCWRVLMGDMVDVFKPIF
jgi:hypothetical protein